MTVELPLAKVDEEWDWRWREMMADRWLCRKLNRNRRLEDHWQYQKLWLPDMPRWEPGHVLDLGPGMGELLEIARHYGHEPIGLEAPSGDGGMGNAYLKACKMMLSRQELPVVRTGLDSLILTLAHAGEYDDPICKYRGEHCLVNSRGSIEQMFADCMHGPPHHLHQDCSRLAWNDDARTRGKMYMFFDVMSDLLRPGGVLLIAANGAANTLVGTEIMMQEAAKTMRYKFVEHSKNWRVLKWRKRTD